MRTDGSLSIIPAATLTPPDLRQASTAQFKSQAVEQ